MVTPFVSWAKVTQSIPNKPDDAYTFQVSVNRVILNATVVDGHNVLVSGLSEGNFQVYEDGVLQQIKNFSHEDIPVTVGILIDNSGSMAPKRNDVIAAALAFARASNPQDQMFVVNFNDHVTFGLPANIPFTDRQEQLQQALSGIAAIGQTSLYDGIAAGLDHLKQGGRARKVLILISDGGDNVSKDTLTQVIDMARHSSAIVYAIGIFDEQDGDQNPAVLRRLAKETGGEAFFPESSGEITSICEEIARDIRNQYTLTYVPANPSQDGEISSRRGEGPHGRPWTLVSSYQSWVFRPDEKPRKQQRRFPAMIGISEQQGFAMRGSLFLRWVHRFLFIAGTIAICYVALTLFHAKLYQAAAVNTLEKKIYAQEQHKASLSQAVVKEGDVLGQMEIPRLGLKVAILAGTSSETLRLGVGHIAGTALPGETGNIGIAGHRDTYFRALKDIRIHDKIQIQTPTGLSRFEVNSIEIVNPGDIGVLAPSAESAVTLVTCYPFHFIGAAPMRFVVHAHKPPGLE